jgi:hypothetical protein
MNQQSIKIISTTTSHILCHLSYLSSSDNCFIIITLHRSILNHVCFIRHKRTLIIISICWLRWDRNSLQIMMMKMMITTTTKYLFIRSSSSSINHTCDVVVDLLSTVVTAAVDMHESSSSF